MVDQDAEERERLRAAGALIGVPVSVSEGDAWELDAHGLQVGLGWYSRRGHGHDEAVALALLQLWERVRDERTAPDRARRRRSVVAARPELEPIVAAVARLQAGAELLAALPGLQDRLAAAVRRGLPAQPGEQARHLQWVSLLLEAGFGGAADPEPDLSPDVAAEWRSLDRHARDAGRAAAGDGAQVELLRRVLGPDPRRGPLERFERALALLLPPYERLLALDAAERGLGDAARGAAAQEHEGGAAPDDLGAAGAGGDAEQEAPEEGDQRGDAAASGEDERARAGEGKQGAEGADLFAAEQAGFVSTVLATPMPAEGALLEASALPEIEAAPRRGDEPREAGGGAGAGGRTASDYRARVAELAGAIERMRQVWARVIAERVARVRSTGRRPAAEGETLSTDALARAVAEARAGVARPAAFLQREIRPRRRRRAGSTDYVLLVDRSASMQGRIAEAAADAALIMLEALAGVERDIAHAEQRVGIDLDLDIRTALVVFDAEPLVVKPLSHGLDDEVRRVMHGTIRAPRGSTNDGAALRAAAVQLGVVPGREGSPTSARDGVERRRIVLLVSDGGSNDPTAAAGELRRLRAAGAAVHGIGIGSDEIVRRYAPSSRRIDEPGAIAEAILELVEDELP